MNVEFNPESAVFSQMNTLKSWVSEKYQDSEEIMQNLQINTHLEVFENLDSREFCLNVPSNDNDKNSYGSTFFAQPGIELPYLQQINKISKIKDNIICLEIAAGFGLVSWKLPYAVSKNGTFYVNDLSDGLMDIFDTMMESRLNKEQQKMMKKIPGDCFKILKNYPELKASVDVIFVKNLEHFFNPKQHQAFFSMISDLLAPNGQAFLTAHTLPPLSKDHDIYKLYESQKNDLYPGFMKYQFTFKQYKDSSSLNKIPLAYHNPERPKDDENCGATVKSSESLGICDIKGIGNKEIRKGTTEVITMRFTPTIYANIIAKDPSLSLKRSFFINNYGHEEKKFSKDSSHCCVIIQKNLEKK
jgi:predicted O-methyltransferase YrrM